MKELVESIPDALIDKRKELEAAMSVTIKAADLATPAMFELVHSLRRQYDYDVTLWLMQVKSRLKFG